jgi:hypothetical protein
MITGICGTGSTRGAVRMQSPVQLYIKHFEIKINLRSPSGVGAIPLQLLTRCRRTEL